MNKGICLSLLVLSLLGRSNAQNDTSRHRDATGVEDSSFTDPRDGKKYKTVKIGNKVWMAENLNYETGRGSYCYDDSQSNCNKYGTLYEWGAAKKAVPPGWHLPRRTEWERLLVNLGGSGSAAYEQMIIGGSSGFDVLFGGWRSATGGFNYLWRSASFWSSSKDDWSSWPWGCDVDRKTKIATVTTFSSGGGLSVRCVKD
jgi:uncharacterized protein (TIGR02145 family)